MKEKFEDFCRAIARLDEALKSEPTELNCDASIQRFEFTYELAWKTLKKFLDQKGIKALNPLDCIKGAFQQGWIHEAGEQLWLDMIKDRNTTTHIYSEELAKKTYDKIKHHYLKEFNLLKAELEKLL